MKAIIFSIFLLFSAVNLFASEFQQQDTIFNQVDHLNQKQGFWKKKYKNGKIAYQGFFKDDKPRGEFKRYHENGVLRAKLTYSSCGDSAKAILYSTSAKQIAEGLYFKNQKDGVWNYYAPDGKLVLTESFKHGKKDGKFMTYYPNGKIYELITWKDDQKNGALIQYFSDGNYKTSIKYENGKENGPIRVYTPSGGNKLEGGYKNGLKHGIWKTFGPNGEVVKQVEYVNGLAVNQDELDEKETRELEQLFKNAGKISDPSVEDFLRSSSPF